MTRPRRKDSALERAAMRWSNERTYDADNALAKACARHAAKQKKEKGKG